MNILNSYVRHSKWGKGKVIKQYSQNGNNYIRIVFEVGEKNFVYPDAFWEYLRHEDRTTQNRILTERAAKISNTEHPDFFEVQDSPEAVLNDRNIETFIHFTRIENLPGILKHGLLSERELVSNKLDFRCNDLHRMDGRRDTVSLSVSFPNYRMLYKLSHGNYDDWIILLLDPMKVVNKNCLYIFKNAACSDIDLNNPDYVDKFNTAISFRRMFYDEPTRAIRGLPKSYTTDPQAEIMVLENIPVEAIKGIAVVDTEMKTRVVSLIGDTDIPVYTESSLFNKRIDSSHWNSVGTYYQGMYYR